MNYTDILAIMDKNAARCAAFAHGVRVLMNARRVAGKLANAPLYLPIALDESVLALATYDELQAMHALTACGKGLINLLAREDCQNAAALDDIFNDICEVLESLRNVADRKTLDLLALMD